MHASCRSRTASPSPAVVPLQEVRAMRTVNIDVVAIRQVADYDCGLACIAMVVLTLIDHLSAGDEQKRQDWSPGRIYQQYNRFSKNNTSIWTIDLYVFLCTLIRDDLRPAFDVRSPRFTTTAAECNNALASAPFYVSDFLCDKTRVDRMFIKARDEGMRVEERRLSTEEVTDLLVNGSALLVVLLDATIMRKARSTTPVLSLSCLQTVFSKLCCDPAKRLLCSCFPALKGKTSVFCCPSSYFPFRRALASWWSSHPQTPAESHIQHGFASSLPTEQCQFQGHYIIARGFDVATQSVIITDPSISHPLMVPLSVFEAARQSFGSDDDIITVYLDGP
ncbi:hypothetical protein DIPPA_00969 [Diplonema papillatum]|nr:hypothetical protein DIPPA_00969 [Diplonema papillatum]